MDDASPHTCLTSRRVLTLEAKAEAPDKGYIVERLGTLKASLSIIMSVNMVALLAALPAGAIDRIRTISLVAIMSLWMSAGLA